MLPAAHRLTEARYFQHAVRTGRRAGSRTLVVHLATSGAADRDGRSASEAGTPLVGFVVSRAVGNAVTRNQVKRRLRHLAREHLASLPGSAVLVVRALPAAAGASSAELAVDLERCLGRVRAEVSR